jgi:hypothetical protein
MTLRLREFRAEDFRSLGSIAYPVSDLDVFVGANGVGKTNLLSRAGASHAPDPGADQLDRHHQRIGRADGPEHVKGEPWLRTLTPSAAAALSPVMAQPCRRMSR